MTFGTVTVGRLALTEALGGVGQNRVDASLGDRTLVVSGQESLPPLTTTVLVQRHNDVTALNSSVIPVTFTDKPDRSGYYSVHDSGADMVNYPGSIATSNWTLTLSRIGTENEIDLESRLSGPQSRQNDFTITGERIHTPPIGAYAYTAGTTVPTTMSRTSADGAITVYRGIALATHPRWACPLASYLNGRCRFIDADGLERSGVGIPTTATGWQINNGLVRVTTSGTVLSFDAWSGGAWQAKPWSLLLTGTPLGTPSGVTILKNEAEMVVIRVTWTQTPGRTTADIALRRGYRFAEVWVETTSSATIRVQRNTTEAGTAATGGLVATANDAAGNKYWVATLRSGATTDLVNGALQKASATTFGFALGAVVGGSGAVSGDAAADLIKQYCGAPAERVEGIRR